MSRILTFKVGLKRQNPSTCLPAGRLRWHTLLLLTLNNGDLFHGVLWFPYNYFLVPNERLNRKFSRNNRSTFRAVGQFKRRMRSMTPIGEMRMISGLVRELNGMNVLGFPMVRD